MAIYRVVKPLPWVEGGEPGIDEDGRRTWVGGEDVVYQPGTEVEIQDCEISSIEHYIEAVDDEGRTVLERVRADNNRPAGQCFIGNAIVDDERERNFAIGKEGRLMLVDAPKGARQLTEWLDRALDEQSPIRRVNRMLQRGDEPSDEDLAAALEMLAVPLEMLAAALEMRDRPQEVMDYAVRRLRGELRKVGRKKGRRLAIPQELAVIACFRDELARLQARGGPVAGGLRTAAYQTVADKLGIGFRTVQQAVLDAEKQETLLSAD